MRKTGNYITHRVKPRSQNTTSQFSRNDCNKFRVKSLKAKNYIQKHYVTVQPQKLVIPITTSFEYNIKRHTHYISEQPNKLVVPVPIRLKGTHQVKVDTHSPSHSEVEHKKHPKEAESDLRIANYDQHNQS